ncbi:MAG: hypothetical protein PHX44_01175 [Sulfurimonas sp.]|uniref:hypothetical protein n=1 Tax=Sulfurimonas sp. TaxID=2022749 RepID=UPI0026275CB7|nr:hypothetical protein [Sulfurimonas sp.]MDD2651645.1 hypothetical protein [Sulfurimonas sp.]MDD3451456.1 hypothetical protein [Sulfurimonas sp.]
MQDLVMTIDILSKIGDEYKSIRVEVGADAKGSWSSSGYEAKEAMEIFKETAELVRIVNGFKIKVYNSSYLASREPNAGRDKRKITKDENV